MASDAEVMPWNEAVTDDEPLPTAVSRPRDPLALDTATTVAVDESQVATLVRSRAVVSL